MNGQRPISLLNDRLLFTKDSERNIFFFYLGKITFCPNELPNGELMDNRGKSFEFDEYQKNY